MSAKTLLILDDDPQVGMVMKLVAESAGVAVRVVETPSDFFRTLNEWSPTHIALDLIIPEMDGVEVITRLSARNCPARIIITSGVGERVLEAARRSANEHGLKIAGILPKPFMSQTFRDLLRDDDNEGFCAEAVKPAMVIRSPIPIAAEDILTALRRHEIQPVYQPQIHCASLRLAGFEALARWHHPKHGLMMPDSFIPIAEESSIIDELTETMFADVTAWLAKTFPETGLTMAVNISSRSAASRVGVRLPMAEKLLTLCESHAIDVSRIVLELTETCAMKDPVSSLALLTRLRMQGLQLAIDDFGTGYSSMLQLVRLPFSEIKIDQSFVSTASTSPESQAVVKSIIDLGRSLKLRVVAEGVEDAGTLHLLRQLGCDLVQGYFISRPLAPNDVIAWTKAWPTTADELLSLNFT